MLLEYLLREGLALNNDTSWKFLALLINICYEVPRSKLAITSLIRENFASSIGVLFDHLKDFQQANYLIELLSNCFPRNSIERTGVVLPPLLWESDDKKMNEIFENSLYPFRGRHGDSQVVKFIWHVFQSAFEQNTLQLKSISYSSSDNMNEKKKFRTLPGSESDYCYVQAIGCQLYLWDGQGRFLEINRKCFEVAKTSKNVISIQLKVPSSECIIPRDKSWLRTFNKAKWFQLEAIDAISCDYFFSNIKNMRKISEVESFLALHQEEEYPDKQIHSKQEQNISGHDYLDSCSYYVAPPALPAQCSLNRKSQLATPEHSDVKVNTDEWEFNHSSQPEQDLPGAAHEMGQTPDNMTPRKYNQNTVEMGNNYEDESPLVLAQKRKMIREATNVLDTLKRDFLADKGGSHEFHVHEHATALVSKEFEQAKRITELRENEKSSEPLTTSDRRRAKKTVKVNSIRTKDIDLLDTIFGTQSSTGQRKKPKKQHKLKNYKPVVDIPSQDISHCKTKSPNKKDINSAEKTKVMNAEKANSCDINETKKVDSVLNGDGLSVKSSVLNNSKRLLSEGNEKENRGDKRQKKDDESAPIETKDKLLVSPLETPSDSPIDRSLNICNENGNCSESTAVSGRSFHNPQFVMHGDSAFTNKLQEQIFNSITGFSNELIRKMAIINKELNKKIVKELSEKYQKIFQELQTSFQSDTGEMLKFMSEIKEMMNLPEEELIQVIRKRKFTST